MENKFYLTTTLPYVNANIHIGHAVEFVIADIIVRYKRDKFGNDNVFFNIGSDEHGLKIYEKAKENNIDVKAFVDSNVENIKEFCKLFSISYTNFYRTTDEKHKDSVYKIWNECLKKGDIYKKKYEGLYCVGCESFKLEKDLIDGKCPDHNKAPVLISEENYFFRLSNYKTQLLNFIDENTDWLKPKEKIHELINFIKDMEDISISRLKEKIYWGIEVPNDETQLIYVWFDALTNYIAAVGYYDDPKKFEEFWPCVQIFGPDNLRFQCAIFQGMLASAGLPFSKKMLMHGMIQDKDGKKMSKSIGNVISPIDQLDKFGVDYVRYYLGCVLNNYLNSSYKEDELIDVCNSSLADNFGNLLNRVIHLSNNYQIEINKFDEVENEFKKEVDTYCNKFEKLMEDYEVSEAYKAVLFLSSFGNKYIDENKPWEKDKTIEFRKNVLNNLSYLLNRLIDMYKFVIPEKCSEARIALEKCEKIILFNKIVK